MKQSAKFLLIILFAAGARGQTLYKEPSIGYVYPAGGQKGTVVQVMIGGQNLKDVSKIFVSGQGVNATNIEYVPPLNGQQLQELRRRLTGFRDKLLSDIAAQQHIPLPRLEEMKSKKTKESSGTNTDTSIKNKIKVSSGTNTDTSAKPEIPVELPDNPLLRNLDKMNLQELKQVAERFLNPNRRQEIKESIQQLAVMDITIDPDAAPGDRELRVWTPAGLSNPMCFQVGSIPETINQKPYDPSVPLTPTFDLPILLNGQILSGDVNRFLFRARQGQHLVIEAQTRHLIPYMADAVPGWFQAALTLYDSNGRELAYSDHYRFSQEPVIFYNVSHDGEYIIEIRDTLYRGREDFVYRLSVGEKPFITQMFPLGAREGFGVGTAVSIAGWNLPENHLLLDTKPGADLIRQTALCKDGWCSNSVSYAVDTLPECFEIKSNYTLQDAQHIMLPQTINGRIIKPGDVGIFRFEADAGYELVAEIYASRLGSPLESLLSLTDGSGRVLAWNNGNEDKSMGLLTDQADAFISFKIPADGVYFVHVSDAEGHGGEEYAYRLRIGSRRPDFVLRVTPSSINMHAGWAVPITVHALRRDGFNGSIEISLKDAPAGFTLNGGWIPAGKDSVRMTLTAPEQPSDSPVILQMEGHTVIDGNSIIRSAIPAEEMMQAFAYWHLVPAETLMADVMENKARIHFMVLGGNGPLDIPAGGAAQVRIQLSAPPRMQSVPLVLQLSEPPKGMSLDNVRIDTGNVMTFTLKADAKEINPGFADNLIVEVFINAVKIQKLTSIGILPAIPFEIVQGRNH